MTNKYEKRLLWHPRQEDKFIVGGGSQLSLYEWAPGSSVIKLVTTQADLQYMKCFTWSPDATIKDLIAIGTSIGRVDLCRLEANRFSTDGTVSGGIITALPIRPNRACNALSFSQEKPNYLAVGLDKVRADSSLVIWDIDQASGSRISGSATGGRTASQARPDRFIVQRYATGESINSISFQQNSADLLVAAGNLWLRQYDLRVNDQHVQQAAAMKIQGIAIDPLEPQRLCTFGDNTVMVWDSRKLSSPLITFSLRDAAADGAQYFPSDHFVHVEFSPVHRGTLATLTRDANHVRLWDLRHTPPFDIQSEDNDQGIRDSQKDLFRTSKLSRLSWAASSTILPWNAPADSAAPLSQPLLKNRSMILANTTHSEMLSRPIVSFALAPLTSKPHSLEAYMAVVGKDNELRVQSLHNIDEQLAWSSRGDLAIGAGIDCKLYPAVRELGPIPEPWELRPISIQRNVQENNLVPKPTRVDGAIETGLVAQESARGDNNVRRASSLSVARLAQGRTFSPASIKHYSTEMSARTATSGPLKHGVKTLASSTPHPLSEGSKEKKSILEGDVSMIMRSRVTQGYGVSNTQNAEIVQMQEGTDSILAGIWEWFFYAKQLLAFGTSKVHGIDFSFQGIMGIWEGLEAAPSQEMMSTLDGLDLASPSESPTLRGESPHRSVDVNASLHPRLNPGKSQRIVDGFHGNYTAALNTLNSRTDLFNEKLAFKSPIHSDKVQRRRLALALCDWKAGDEQIAKWESQGEYAKAACWLLFTNQGGRAIELLMRSKDESHLMMSGTIAAILQSGSSLRNQDLRDSCTKLINKLQDPHFRMMLSYIVYNDWSDILEEDNIPLRERIAIALRFLEDKDLTQYLRRVASDCQSKGNIEGLIVTGLTQRGLNILQSYVDMTGDVQTAAILASYVCPGRLKDRRVERWTDAYRDLLDKWKLFHYRCQFDIDRGKIIKEGIGNGDIEPMEWVQRQFLIRCNFCNKVMSNVAQNQRPQEPIALQRRRVATCSSCGRTLPRCSVCLMSICVVTDPAREKELLHSSFRDTIDDALVFCQTCRHGGHASHILEWFHSEQGVRKTCPVADCECYCDE